MDTDASPNADSIVYWNEDAGPRWARQAEKIDIQLEPFLEPLARISGIAPGDRVLDVGCGAGALSLFLAARVEPGGAVTGIDVSDGLLAVARKRSADSGRTLDFHRADAQVEAFEPGSYDRVVSRFGVMFFEDTVAAFRNLRRSLRAGGTLSFVSWAAPEVNPWMAIPREVLARHIELPERRPDEPGPFRFADADGVLEICREAGFTDVGVEALEGSLVLGGRGSLDEAVAFLLEVGPLAQVRGAGAATLRAVRDDLREALGPHAGPRGVELGSRAWLFRAR